MEAIRELIARLFATFYRYVGHASTDLNNLGIPQHGWENYNEGDVHGYVLDCLVAACKPLRNGTQRDIRPYLPSIIEHFRLKEQLGEIEKLFDDDRAFYRRAMLQLTTRVSALDTQGWLMFASLSKPKPILNFAQQTLVDLSNTALILRSPLPLEGVTVGYLKQWWEESLATEKLVVRMRRSIDASSKSAAELKAFDYFYREYYSLTKERFPNDRLPALLPQVWLNYDPLTQQQRGGQPYVDSQRVDFAFVLPGRKWVVMEIDGDSHYAFEQRPSPERYRQTVRATRNFLLDGTECYRFTNEEILGSDGEDILLAFWSKVLP